MANIRDMLISVLISIIIVLGVLFAFKPESLGYYLQKIDNARFYNNAPIEFE